MFRFDIALFFLFFINSRVPWVAPEVLAPVHHIVLAAEIIDSERYALGVYLLLSAWLELLRASEAL